MLLSFSVSNFRSIRDEATLSMFALKRVKEHPENTFQLPENDKIQLLRSLVIYGANASGKSNLITALHTVTSLMGQDSKVEPVQQFYHPFLLDEKTEKEPVKFRVSLAIPMDDGQLIPHEYSLIFDQEGVLYESLFYTPRGQRATIFQRTRFELKLGEHFQKGQSFVREFSRKNHKATLLNLFLSLGVEEFSAIARYQKYNPLFSHNPLHGFPDQAVIENNFVSGVQNGSIPDGVFKKFEKFISAIDTGIAEIRIEDIAPDISQDSIFNKRLETYHLQKGEENGKKIRFGKEMESDGTKNLLTYGGFIMFALATGKTLIMDEIDRSLHPKIVEYIFKLYNDPMINTKGAQLIASTHSAMIMRNDLFRRDQIVIAERGDDGASTYYNLAEVQGLRAGVPFERYYYAGMLGGTPDINDVDFRAEFL